MSKPLKCTCLDFNEWSFYFHNLRCVGTLKDLDNHTLKKLLAEMNTIEYSSRTGTSFVLIYIKLTSNEINNSTIAQVCRRCDKKHNYGLMFYAFLLENFDTLPTHNAEIEAKENMNG